MLQFSPLEEKHLKAILGVVNYYILHTTVSFSQVPITKKDLRVMLFHANPLYQSYVIETDNELVGFCALLPWKPESAFSKTASVCVYLSYDERGKGMGEVALAFLEGKARENRITSLVVEVCNENYPAISLLERHEFARCGRLSQTAEKFNRALDIIYFKKSFAAS